MADIAEKPTDEVVADATMEDAKTKEVTPAVVEKKNGVEVVDSAAADEAKDAVEEAKEAVEDVEAPAKAAADDDKSVEKNEETPSKLETEIIRQLEYYFGDANLNRDKFLLGQITNNEDGWVPLSVMLTFKRLSSLSTDTDVIINALIKSDEGLIEISEDKQKLRRHPERPIPEHNEERRKEIMSRTAYAKGFPLDTEMDDLIEFFNPNVKVVNINMRKYLDKASKKYKFKGSVFVTFDKKEQTEEFIKKEKVVYKERELTRKWQEAYLNEKKEELKSKSKKKTKAAEEEIQLPKGTVVFFEGANEKVTRELLREAIEKVGVSEIAYIDYSKGDKEGHIRFMEENTAAPFLEKLDENKLKLSVDDIELALRPITDEEEKVFLQKAVENMKNRRKHQKQHKGGHHHGNRKRRGGHERRNDDKKRRSNDD